MAAGIKTISLRIIGTKEGTELLEAEGEEIDNFIKSTEAKKQEIIKDYTAVKSNNYKGFDILDENGNYKNTYDILLGISKIYKEIQAEDKKFGTNRAMALIEELAGKNRSNIVSAILSNSDILESVKESSEQASGSAMRENEKYLDSIEGKMSQLTTSIEEFWNKTIDSDVLKLIIDLLTNALSLVNDLIGSIGSLPSILSTVSPIIGKYTGIKLLDYGAITNDEGKIEVDENGKKMYGFSGLIPELFKKSSGNNTDDIINKKKEILNINRELGESESTIDRIIQDGLTISNTATQENIANKEALKATNEGVAVSEKMVEDGAIGSSIAVETFGHALKTIGSYLVTMIAVATAFKVVEVLGKKLIEDVIFKDKYTIEDGNKALESITNSIKNYKDEEKSIKSLGESFSDDTETIESTSDAINTLSIKYSELKKGVNEFDNSNKSLSTEDYESFLSLSNEIAEIMPNLVTGYDANGNAILDLGTNVSDTTEKMNEFLDVQKQMLNSNISEQLNTLYAGLSTQDKQLNDKILEKSREFVDITSTDDFFTKSLTNYGTPGSVERKLYEAQKKIESEVRKSLVDLNGVDNFDTLSDKQKEALMKTKAKELGYNNDEILSAQELYNIQTKNNQVLKEKNALELERKNLMQQMLPSLTNYLQTEATMSELDDSLLGTITNNLINLKSLNFDNINENYNGDLMSYLYENVISLFSDSNFTDEIQNKLSNLFANDYTEHSMLEFVNKFQEFASQVYDVGTDQYKSMAELFGIDDMINNYMNNLEKAGNQVTDFTEHGEDLLELSQHDFNIMVDLIDKGFNGTYAQLMSKIDEINKKKIRPEVLPLDIDSLLSIPGSKISQVIDAFEGENHTEKGDTYAKVLGYLDEMQTLYDNNDIGTKKFKSLAAFFSPTGSDDLSNYVENKGKIDRYFTKDSIDGVYNFMDDLVKTIGEEAGAKLEDGIYHLPDYFNADEIGRKMGISGEALVTLMGEAMDKGLTNDFFTDDASGMDTIISIQEELNEARLRYNKLQAEGANSTALDAQKEKIQDLKDRLDEAKESLQAYYDTQDKNSKKGQKLEKENKKDINTSINEYKRMRSEYGTGKTNQLWEERSEQYEYSIIKQGQEAGLDTGYNKRGQLVTSMEESNAKLDEFAKQIDIVTGAQKASNAELQAAKDKIHEFAQEYGITDQQFIDRYSSDKWLDDKTVAEMNNDVFASEVEKQTSELIEAITNIAPEFGEQLSKYFKERPESKDDGIKDTGLQTGEAGKVNPKQNGKLSDSEVSGIITEGISLPVNLKPVDTEFKEKEQEIEETPVDATVNFTTSGYTGEDATDGFSDITIGVSANTSEAQKNLDNFDNKSDEVDGKQINTSFTLNGIVEAANRLQNFLRQAIGLDNRTFSTTFKETHIKETKTITTPTKYVKPDAHGTITKAFAHGSSNVTSDGKIKHMEKALINEVAPEIIIRGNQAYIANDGNPAFETLKPGDIVLNHQISDELLRNGKATHGHGKIIGGESAFAHGTSGITISNAYANMLSKNKVASTKSGSSSSSKSDKKNTDATKKNTDSKKKNTKATNKNSEAIDWVARRLTYLGNKTKEIADKITDYISSAMKKSLLKKQYSAAGDEIAANKNAQKKYQQMADKVDLKASLKKKVREGSIDITKYGDKTREAIQKYQDYYDNVVKCKQAVQELSNTQMQLFEQLMNIPLEKAQKTIDGLEKRMNIIKSVGNILASGGSAYNLYKNIKGNVFSNYENYKASVQAAKEKKTKAKNNVDTAASKIKKDTKGLKKNSDGTYDISSVKAKAKSDTDKANRVSKYNKAQEDYSKASKALTAKDKKRKKNKDGTYSLKGLDKKSAQYKRLKAYNDAVKARTKAKNGLKKDDTKGLKKNKNGTYDISKLSKNTDKYNRLKAYNDAQNAYNTAKSDYTNKSSLSSEMEKLYSELDAIKQQGGKTYELSNKILDLEYQIKKEQNDAAQKGLNEANQNLQDATVAKNNADKKIGEKGSKSTAVTGSKAFKKLSKSKQKEITDAISKKNKISTKGIKDKDLLKKIQAYNDAVQAARDKASEYTLALEAQEEAAENAATSAEELAEMAIENEKQKFANIKQYYDARLNYQKALDESANRNIEMKNATGKEVNREDYQAVLDNMVKSQQMAYEQVEALQAELDQAVADGIIVEGSEEWYELAQQILDAKNSAADMDVEMANLKKTMAEIDIKKLTYQMNELQKEMDVLNDELDRWEMRGGMATEDDYNKLITQSEKENALLQEQIAEWKKLQEGMDKNSEAYQEYQSQIDQAESQIRANKKQQLEWNLAIEDLPLKVIEKLNSLLGSIVSYYESLIGLMEASGKVISSSDYEQQIIALRDQRNNQEEAKNYAYQKWQEALENGEAEDRDGNSYTADHWEQTYWEAATEVNRLDTSIAELQRTIDELPWKKIQNELSCLEAAMSELNDSITLLEVKGLTPSEGDYRGLIAQSKSNVANYQSQIAELRKLQADAQPGSEIWYQYENQIHSLEGEIRQAEINQEEWNNAIINLPLTRLEKALDLVKAIAEYNSSINELVQAMGYDLSKGEYQKLIADQNDSINNLLKQRQMALENARKAQSNGGAYGGKSTEEWEAQYRSLGTEVNNARIEIEQLKDAMREDVQFRGFDRLFKTMDRLRTELEIIRAGIDDEDLYDKDTGALTNKGYTAIGVAQQELKSYQKDIETANAKIARIKSLHGSDGYSEDEYLEDLANAEQELLSAVQGEMDARKEIKSLIEESVNKELEAVQKLIDKWSEALDAQKEIYDYSKNIKKQAQEVANIEKQLIYLQGDTSEENKARIQQLKVSYEDAKDQLYESEFDHYISEQKKLVDELTNEWTEHTSEYVDTIVESLGDMTGSLHTDVDIASAVVTDRIAVVDDDLLTTKGEISNVIIETSGGISGSIGEGATGIKDGITEGTGSLNESMKDGFGGIGDLIKQLLEYFGINLDGDMLTNNAMGGYMDMLQDFMHGDFSGISSMIEKLFGNLGIGIDGNFGDVQGWMNNMMSQFGINLDDMSWDMQSIMEKLNGFTGKSIEDNAKFITDILESAAGDLGIDFGKVIGENGENIRKYIEQFGGTLNGNFNSMINLLTNINSGINSLSSSGSLPSHASGTRKAKTNLAWTNENGNGEIIRTSDGAILTPVGKGGMVFDNAASQRLWDLAHGDDGVFLTQAHFQSIADELSKAFAMASQIGSSEFVNNGGNITISNMTIELPNVQNPEQFAEAFQDQFYKILTTKRGERAVQSVTTDRLVGGSTIGKYKR